MDADLSLSTKEAPTVTVLMATFNRAHLIAESIDSILNQTRPPDEFIVVNDGSTDGTADVVRRYGDRIKYIEKPNGGKPSALNLVLPQVKSTYIWIFDDDDVALPEALALHLRFLSENPQCDFSYATNYVFRGEFSEAALQRGKLKAFPAHAHAAYFRWIMESASLPTLMPAMLIPTRCYRAVGAFDEALMRGQDLDMVLRIARRFRAGYVGQPAFAERLHDGHRGPAFERHAEAERYRVWQRYRRRIFAKVRASLTLAEYLPTSGGQAATHRRLGSMQVRQALLGRAVIMATHGLFDEALDDFRNYVDKLGAATQAPSHVERQYVSRMTWVANADALPPRRYHRRVGALTRSRPALFGAAARGLYWSLAREVRQQRFRAASTLLGRAASLASAHLIAPVRRPDADP